jgi:hypothetical protein
VRVLTLLRGSGRRPFLEHLDSGLSGRMVQLLPAPALPLPQPPSTLVAAPSTVVVPAPLSTKVQGKQPVVHTAAAAVDVAAANACLVAVPAAAHACVERVERRCDSDGVYYTFAEFVEFHGAYEQDAAAAGMRAWRRAARTSTKLERRVDTSHLGDGNAYTYDEFVSLYAGYSGGAELTEWDAAHCERPAPTAH